MTRLPADQSVRERILGDLGTTLVVEAAAGTGKTTALVGRVVALVRTGTARLEQVVAVTFTEKAAGEMKLRLRSALEKARRDADPVERARLDDALLALEAMRIGTIHGLCADLLRERPVEAGIDPLFAVADEDEALSLYDQAFEAWFQGALAAPGEGVRRILRREAWSDDTQPRTLLWKAGWSLVDNRDFDGAWRRPPFARDAAIDAFLADLFDWVAVHDRALHPQDYLARQVGLVRRWADEVRHREKVVARDHDELEASLRGLKSGRFKWHWAGSQYKREFADGVARADVLARREAVKAALDALVAACEVDLAPCLREELRPLVARYEHLKERAGRLDFHDLLQRARDLLARDRSVRADLQRRFTHLLVDEFQDTDPLQADILLLLAADDPDQADPARVRAVPGKLFIVGDPKQSIYRFRRADVAFYQRVVDKLSDQGAAVLPLSTSFRGDPRVQDAVNAAFEPRMAGGTQAGWVPLDRWRDPDEAHPAVIALPFPRQFGDNGRLWKGLIDESVPRAVGGWIQWLLDESGWTVDDPVDGHRVPVAARHVCLLFKRFQSFGTSITAPYAQALEARGIPHVLVGGRSLHDREEIQAVRTALAAIEWPDDELSVFATLKGPLFAVADDALLAWREQVGPLHPTRPFDEEALAPIHREVSGALAVLRDLHRSRNRRPAADTVVALLQATRAHAGLANWVAGEQVLANVERVALSARRFEARGATSFRAFLAHLDAEARRNDASQAAVVEEGTEGVRIMTVHGAKGLEFPIVVLCDPTCPPTWDKASRWVDPGGRVWAMALAGCTPADVLDHEEEVLRQDAEEADRLLYVAATRARDALVVPASGLAPLEDSWLAPLWPTLYPDRANWRRAGEAPGCPAFGDETVPDLPDDTATTVRPGLHAPERGGHGVVWWDPSVLRLSVRGAQGLRNQDLLTEDAEGRAAKSLRDHSRWVAARTKRLVAGAAPTVVVRTPTELAHEATDQVPIFHAIRVERTEATRAERPHGKRFGVLVHAVLADVPLDADADAVARSAALHGRLVGAPDDEVRAATDAVTAALAHDLLRRAAASPDCRREVPLVVRSPDGGLVEGNADLAFLDPATDRWVVVDFKTDVELGALRAAYEVQVSWYVRAVREATGRAADGYLLQV